MGILTDVKKLLGIDEAYTHFDVDIIMHINTTLSVLEQLGIGPKTGFSISDDTANWVDFIPANYSLELIKSYVYMKVRLIFDPPINGSVIEALKQNIAEMEWRIRAVSDAVYHKGGDIQNE